MNYATLPIPTVPIATRPSGVFWPSTEATPTGTYAALLPHRYWTHEPQLSAHEQQCDELLALQPGWDSYDAAPPNREAVGNAKALLQALALNAGLLPKRVCASAAGGVGLVFSTGANYVDIECFNNGEVLLGNTRADGSISVDPLDLGDVPDLLRRLRARMRG